MASFGGMGAMGGDHKTQIMRQVQQEAAMQNARMLVEVRFFHEFPLNFI
jgi:import inner membrane translocase subunit TIM13